MTHRLARFSLAAHEDPAALFMPLRLVIMPATTIGIYRIDGVDNRLPARMLYLRREAATSFACHLAHTVIVSDMLRSLESSLNAKRNRAGAQRPGYSGHNCGNSIDIAVTQVMQAMGFTKKADLDVWMAERGWHCHRRDHRRGREEWHYNFFTPDEFNQFVFPKDRRTSIGLERWISATHGAWWHKQSPTDSQRCLRRLGMYDGDLDGAIGPISKSGIQVFQRAWIPGKRAHGKLDVMTRRTLAFASAERVEVDL